MEKTNVKFRPADGLIDLSDSIINVANAVTPSDPNADQWGEFRDAFEVLNEASEKFNEINEVAEALDTREYRRSIEDLKRLQKLLQDKEKLADALELPAGVAKSIPNSFVRNAGAITEKTIRVSENFVSRIESLMDRLWPLEKVITTIDAIDKKTGTLRDTVGDVNDALVAYDIFVDTFEDHSTMVYDAYEGFFSDYSKLTAPPAFDVKIDRLPEGSVNDRNADGGFQISIATATAPAANAVFSAFENRLDNRADKFDAVRKLAVDFVEFIKGFEPNLNLDIVDKKVQEIVDAINDIFAAISDWASQFDPLAPISDIMSFIGKTLSIITDAIQPVIDLFGPVASAINAVIDKLEDALGIKALKDYILSKVREPIDDLLEELEQYFNDAIEPLLKLIEQFKDLFSGLDIFLDFWNDIWALLYDPMIEVGSGTLETETIQVGEEGSDLINMQVDAKAVDGYGGMATGGAGKDIINGTELSDLINGGDGDDVILGGGGDVGTAGLVYTGDVIFGANGDDSISGEAGRDALSGGDGDDVISGGTGGDHISGDAGNDVLDGDDGNDLIEGGTGDDTIRGGQDNDTLFGGAGIDKIFDADGANTIDGGSGLDLINTKGATEADSFLILDADAVLEGGIGSDTVQIGRQFALDINQTPAGTFYDGGRNQTDRFIAEGINLGVFGGIIEEFETLEISSTAGSVSTLKGSTPLLAAFRSLEFSGSGSVKVELLGDLDLNSLQVSFDQDPLIEVPNPQDRPELNLKRFAPVTVDVAAGLSFTGYDDTTGGMALNALAGGATIFGGGGSDVIRAGTGIDLLSGGKGDVGNKFDIDGAVGDVIVGTGDELNGDTIADFTNRVDRVRVLGSDSYEVEVSDANDGKTVTIREQGTDAQLGAVVSTFLVTGEVSKLFFRGGTGVDGAYTEIFNNNIPPTATDDDVETTWQQAGDPAIAIDPFANDFDADTKAGTITANDGALDRRSIAITGSENLLFGLTTEAAIMASGGREAFVQSLAAVPVGTELITKLGNAVVKTSDGLVYEAPEPVVEYRRLNSSDGLSDVYTNLYDASEDLPFFGFDSFSYQVVDSEGETSRTALFEVLIRPDQDTTVTVRGENGDEIAVGFNLVDTAVTVTGGYSNRLSLGDPANANLASAFGGNDYITVAQAGSHFAGGGNDVLDARNANASVFLNGGTAADWVEGGAFADFLTGGGFNDGYFVADTRVDSPQEAPPRDILIGNGGDNVYTTSTNLVRNGLEPRDTVFVLNGGAETIYSAPMTDTGDINASSVTLNYLTQAAVESSLTVFAARAIAGDEIRGFDTDDQILIPVDLTETSDRTTRKDSTSNSQGTLNGGLTTERGTGLIVTDEDISSYLGGTNSFVDDLFIREGWNNNSLKAFSITQFVREGSKPTFTVSDSTPPAFNQVPQFLTYDIGGTSFADDGATLSKTVLSVDLQYYSWIHELRFRDVDWSRGEGERVGGVDGAYVTVEGKMFLRPKLISDNRFLDPDRAFDGGPVTLSFEFDGYYNPDRFFIETVNPALSADIPRLTTNTSRITTDLMTSNGGTYQLIDDVRTNAAVGSTPIGLSLRYASFAPEGVADDLTVERGKTLTVDITSNDTDADGDEIQIFDLIFDTPEDEARLLDGDTTNGEIILETDPNTGLGTGVLTYVAPEFFANPDDTLNEISFSYIATDGEFETDPIRVQIDITGQPVVVEGETILLPFDTDGIVAAAQFLLNDYDPDTPFAAISTELLRSYTPNVSNNATSDAPQVQSLDLTGAPVTNGGSSAQPIESIEISLDALEAARAQINAGENLSEIATTFEYLVADDGTGALTAPVVASFAMAAPLELTLGSFGVQSGRTISIDLINTLIGGSGNSEIDAASNLSVVASDGSVVDVGSVKIAGSQLVIATIPYLDDIEGSIRVSFKDDIGSTLAVDVPVQISKAPGDASPLVIRLDAPPDQAQEISISEDEIANTSVLILDPDDIVLGTPPSPEALAILKALDGNPAEIATMDLTGVVAPPNVTDRSFETQLGGDVTLKPTVNPFVWQVEYTPAENANGVDQIDVPVNGLTVPLSVNLASVNDAPIYEQQAPSLALNIDQTLTIDAIADLVDVDGSLDLVTLQITYIADASDRISITVTDGLLEVSALASGIADFNVDIKDNEGLAAPTRAIRVDVNADPTARDDFLSVTSSTSALVIDPLANDDDRDGTSLDFVRDETGAPLIEGPTGSSFDDTGTLAIAGTLVWNKADDSLQYMAPQDPGAIGKSDVFTYQITDEDGALSAATIQIDIQGQAPNAASRLSIGTLENDAIEVTADKENFILGAGSDILIGLHQNFDGDAILDLGPDDLLRLTDVSPSALSVEVTRETSSVGTLQAFNGVLVVENLFDDATVNDIYSAFQGSSLLTLTTATNSATVDLTGAYLGDFDLAAFGTTGTDIRYVPVAPVNGASKGDESSEELVGSDLADLLEGEGGNDILRGMGGDDRLIGGAGSDVLIGGDGTDTLTGGTGADLFVLDALDQVDTITDYTPGEGDRIVVNDGVLLVVPDDSDIAPLAPEGSVDISRFTLDQTGGSWDLSADFQFDEDSDPDVRTIATITPTDSASLRFGAFAASVVEGSSATTDLSVTLIREGAADDPARSLLASSIVQWAVEPGAGSGVSPADFVGGQLPSGSVTFAPGETQKTINLAIAPDARVEEDEALNVRLISATGASIGQDVATSVIIDDDAFTLIDGISERDNLVGTDGADRIASGAGPFDKMTGGAGPDVFVFADELSNGVIERDLITDFELGIDQIVTGGASVVNLLQTSGGLALILSGDGDVIFIRAPELDLADISLITDLP